MKTNIIKNALGALLIVGLGVSVNLAMAQAKKAKPKSPEISRTATDAGTATDDVVTVRTATIQWDDNPASEAVTAYTVYEASPDGTDVVLGTVVPPAESKFTTGPLVSGPHTFYVTATNSGGTSPPSEKVTLPGGPAAPGNVRITVNITLTP